MAFRRRKHNDNSYDTCDAYNTIGRTYHGSVVGLKDVGLGSMLGLKHSSMLNSPINMDAFSSSRIIYPQYSGVTGFIDWPVQSDIYSTIGNKPAPLTVMVSKTLIEDQHQTIHVPRIVIDTAKKIVSIPRTVLEKKSRMIQEPRTIYEQQSEEYKVPRTVIEQEIRVIQVPRTVYDEHTITVNVPKTIYESHSRIVTVPKTVIQEREEFYEVPRQVVENREVNYEVPRTVYDMKTSVIQVPRTVIETKLIEAKPVTYHVTKYEYPNLNESSSLNGAGRGYSSDGNIISDPLALLGPAHIRDLNSSRGLERLSPNAKKSSCGPTFGMSKYEHSHHNPYGQYGTNKDTRPRSENTVYSHFPYPLLEGPCLSSSFPVPVPVPDDSNNSDLNGDAGILPSLIQHSQPKAAIFNRTKQNYYHRD